MDADAQRYGAVPIVQDGRLVPRFFVDRKAPMLRRDGQCAQGSHPCNDIDQPDLCCSNDLYCIVQSNGTAGCCQIGRNCMEDSLCSSDHYYCTTTTTIDATVTSTQGCCPRRCPSTSAYLCASDRGGKCCSYGSECRADGQCLAKDTNTGLPTLETAQPGCTTSQHKCADGSGCCNNNYRCTQVSQTAYCALGNPSGTGISIVGETSGGGLTTGAKAGIAVGVIAGVALILGVAAWLCVSKRKRRRQRAMSHQSGVTSRPGEEGLATEMTFSRPPEVGFTQDYFGPDPVAGPFTEHPAVSETGSPVPGRAVPPTPQGPADIAAPVEIDSSQQHERAEREPWTPETPQTQFMTPPTTHGVEGRFELYGSDAHLEPRSPSPLVITPISPRSESGRTADGRTTDGRTGEP